MNKFIITLSKPAMVLLLAFGCLNSYAQNAPDAPKEERISNTDLIKLATKAPFRQKFATEEEYSKVKDTWIKEYPDANDRIQGRGPAGGDEAINNPQTQNSEPLMSQYNVPNENDFSSEEQYHTAKSEWIEKNPDKYQTLLKASE